MPFISIGSNQDLAYWQKAISDQFSDINAQQDDLLSLLGVTEGYMVVVKKDDFDNFFKLLNDLNTDKKKSIGNKIKFILPESCKNSLFTDFDQLDFIPDIYFAPDKDIEDEEKLKIIKNREDWYNDLENKANLALEIILANKDKSNDKKIKILSLIIQNLPYQFHDIDATPDNFDIIVKEFSSKGFFKEESAQSKSLEYQVKEFHQELRKEKNLEKFLTLNDKKDYPGLHISAKYKIEETEKEKSSRLVIEIEDVTHGGLGHYAGFEAGDKLFLKGFFNNDNSKDIVALSYFIEKLRKGNLDDFEVERRGEKLKIEDFQSKINTIYTAPQGTYVGNEVRKIIYGTNQKITKYANIGREFLSLKETIDKQKFDSLVKDQVDELGVKVGFVEEKVENWYSNLEKQINSVSKELMNSLLDKNTTILEESLKALEDIQKPIEGAVEIQSASLNQLLLSCNAVDNSEEMKNLIVDLAKKLGYTLNKDGTNFEASETHEASENKVDLQKEISKITEVLQDSKKKKGRGNVMDDIKEQITSYVAKLKGEINSMLPKGTITKEDIDKLKSKLDEEREKAMKDVSEQLAKNGELVDSKLTGLNLTVAKLENEVSETQSKVDELETKVESVVNNINILRVDIKAMISINQEVENISMKIADLEKKYIPKSTDNKKEEQVKRIELGSGNTSAQNTEDKTSFQDLQTKLSKLELSCKQQQKDQNDITIGHEEKFKKLSELNLSNDRHIKKIREDMKVMKGNLNTVLNPTRYNELRNDIYQKLNEIENDIQKKFLEQQQKLALLATTTKAWREEESPQKSPPQSPQKPLHQSPQKNKPRKEDEEPDKESQKEQPSSWVKPVTTGKFGMGR